MADFTSALKIDTLNIDAYRNLAITFLNSGQLKNALFDVNHAIRIAPQDVYMKGIRGFVNLRLNNYAESIKDYDIVISSNPAEARLYYYENIDYFNLKDYRKAAELFTKTLELDPNFPDASRIRDEALKLVH